jgi:hypothetical protein
MSMDNVEAVMEEHGFRLSASCGGQASYTKTIPFQGRRALISVNEQGGGGLPVSMNDPVLVTVTDLRSGDDVEPARTFSTLAEYLTSVTGRPRQAAI